MLAIPVSRTQKPTPSRARAHKGYAPGRHPGLGMLFVSPLAAIVFVLFLIPLGVLVFMSFQHWSLLGSPSPGGLSNYRAIPANSLFTGAISFTLIYTVLATIAIFGVSFVLVAVSNAKRHGANFYRTAFFLPYVVGTASAALIWLAIVNDQNGVGNRIMQDLGVTTGPWGFLDTGAQALFTTLTLVVWKFIGFQVIVLLVGLQSVPGELYEAARVDGASTIQRLRFITLPYLRPTLALLLILSITGSLLAFDQFQVLTHGGPDNSTVTLVMAIYDTAFAKFDLGRAAALSIILLFALLLVNGVQLLLLRGRDEK